MPPFSNFPKWVKNSFKQGSPNVGVKCWIRSREFNSKGPELRKWGAHTGIIFWAHLMLFCNFFSITICLSLEFPRCLLEMRSAATSIISFCCEVEVSASFFAEILQRAYSFFLEKGGCLSVRPKCHVRSLVEHVVELVDRSSTTCWALLWSYLVQWSCSCGGMASDSNDNLYKSIMWSNKLIPA